MARAVTPSRPGPSVVECLVTSEIAAVPRRTVLATGAAGAGVALAAGDSASAATSADRRKGRKFFQHGIASGDPLPDAVLIWTRVTPNHRAKPGSGKGPRAAVRWEVATDKRFRRVVRRGTFETGPSRDHTVKVDVTGLKPETWYYYRFHYQAGTSRVGRTRTAPSPNATPDHLRFGVVSCANWQAGWFTAYRGLARRTDLPAVPHLGAYLYGYAPGAYGSGSGALDIRRRFVEGEFASER